MDQAEVMRYKVVKPQDLPAIRAFVRKTAVSFGGTNDAISALVAATNEAVTNILNHGYENDPGSIEITVGRQKHQLIIQLRDRAHPFDPTTVSQPDITLPLADRTPGGLGVHMMREFTDALSYRTTKNGENELIMIKFHAIGDEE